MSAVIQTVCGGKGHGHQSKNYIGLNFRNLCCSQWTTTPPSPLTEQSSHSARQRIVGVAPNYKNRNCAGLSFSSLHKGNFNWQGEVFFFYYLPNKTPIHNSPETSFWPQSIASGESREWQRGAGLVVCGKERERERGRWARWKGSTQCTLQNNCITFACFSVSKSYNTLIWYRPQLRLLPKKKQATNFVEHMGKEPD